MSKDNGETGLTLNYTPVEEVTSVDRLSDADTVRMRMTYACGTVIEFDAANIRVVPPEELEEE